MRIFRFLTLTVSFTVFLLLQSTAASGTPFQKGEKIIFKIRVFGIHVGNQTMSFHGKTLLNGKEVLYATADTRSLPYIEKTFNYKLHDVMHVWMDPGTLLPVKVFKDIQEGNWKNKVTIMIDQSKNTAIYYDKRTPKGKKHTLTNPTLDILSLIYYIRANRTTTGKTLVLDYLVDKKGVSQVKLKITAGEPLQVENHAIPTVHYTQLGGHGVKVRLTDDKYRLPLSISVATFEVHGYSIDIVGHLIKYSKGSAASANR